ncbi:MAG: hypothetical protein D6734_09640 [Candidatus Schekmanbacteria bacterium]|nr:MAG: hypothetical protein D6734_09640 [Candidatus Schekmanbacteria bacterium]
MKRDKIIIDTDCGIDDAIAIKVASHYFGKNLIAITVVAGNVPIEKAGENVCRLLPLFNENYKNIPIYLGSGKPLRGKLFPFAFEYHSSDGLGGLSGKIDKIIGSYKINASKISAIEAMADIVRKEKSNSLRLITIGPLTNIAKAILKYPDIMKRIKEIIIMGGSFYYPGNITPLAEFNVYCDPYAASVVFSSEIPIRVLGLNITERVFFKKNEVERCFKDAKGQIGKVLKELLLRHIKLHRRAEKFEGAFQHDPVAVVAALKPNLFWWERRNVNIIVENKELKGMTYADFRRKSIRSGNTLIAVDLDIEAVKKVIIEGIQ